MKLSEIEAIPSMPNHGIHNFSPFDKARPIPGQFILSEPLIHNEEGGFHYFCAKGIMYVTGQANTYEGRPCIALQRTWIEPEYRGKGLMKAIYLKLKSLGYVVLSDEGLSPQSIKIWKSLCDSGHAVVIDLDTGETRTATDTDFTDKNLKTRFIME